MSYALRQLPMLVRREFWEHRWAFVYTPLIIAGLAVLLLLMGIMFAMEVDSTRLFAESTMREFAGSSEQHRAAILRIPMLALLVNFNAILQIVLFFYLVGTLYDERKDRSILFWKSLPVSDTTTIAGKLLTAGIAVPAAYLLTAAALQLLFLLVACAYALAAGVPLWSTVLAPANLPALWFSTLIAIPVQMLWALPLFGWFLLVSAFAPRLPWLIALGIPGLAGLFQNYFSLLERFQLAEHNLWLLFWQRFADGVLPVRLRVDEADIGLVVKDSMESAFTLEQTLSRLTATELWIGALVGMLLLYGAIWLRARATDR